MKYKIKLTNVPDGCWTEEYIAADRMQPSMKAAKKVVADFKRGQKSRPSDFEPGMQISIEKVNA